MAGEHAGFHQTPARSLWEQLKQIHPKEICIFFWAPIKAAWIYSRVALGKMDFDTMSGLIWSFSMYEAAFRTIHDEVKFMARTGDTSVVPVLVVSALRRMEAEGRTVQEFIRELECVMSRWALPR